jgi:aspartyl-tRNA(Asn)/glutamyl-tRNA(Gln) amidotransferase subunit C
MNKPIISEEQLQHLARLAKVELGKEERQGFAHDLSNILDYMKILDSYDTENVKPMAHVQLEQMPLREDVPVPSLAHDVVFAQAPNHDGTGFVVPGFVDETKVKDSLAVVPTRKPYDQA